MSFEDPFRKKNIEPQNPDEQVPDFPAQEKLPRIVGENLDEVEALHKAIDEALRKDK